MPRPAEAPNQERTKNMGDVTWDEPAISLGGYTDTPPRLAAGQEPSAAGRHACSGSSGPGKAPQGERGVFFLKKFSIP